MRPFIALTLWFLVPILAAGFLLMNEASSNNAGAYRFVVEEATNPWYEGGFFSIDVIQPLTGSAELSALKQSVKASRTRTLIQERKRSDIELCIERITENWQRTYASRSFVKEFDEDGKELSSISFSEVEDSVSGFDDENDFELKWRLRNKALDGEKICRQLKSPQNP